MERINYNEFVMTMTAIENEIARQIGEESCNVFVLSTEFVDEVNYNGNRASYYKVVWTNKKSGEVKNGAWLNTRLADDEDEGNAVYADYAEFEEKCLPIQPIW